MNSLGRELDFEVRAQQKPGENFVYLGDLAEGNVFRTLMYVQEGVLKEVAGTLMPSNPTDDDFFVKITGAQHLHNNFGPDHPCLVKVER